MFVNQTHSIYLFITFLLENVLISNRKPLGKILQIIIIIIIIFFFLHGLGHLTSSGIDTLPSFPGASTISSSSRFVAEGVFRKSGVVHSF